MVSSLWGIGDDSAADMLDVYLCAVAAGEGRQFGQRDAVLPDLGQGFAAIEQVFVEPAPRTLPRSSWIDRKRVESHGQTGKTAIGGFILGVELFDELEEGFRRAETHGFGKKGPTFGGREGDTGIFGQTSPIEGLFLPFGRHGGSEREKGKGKGKGKGRG